MKKLILLFVICAICLNSFGQWVAQNPPNITPAAFPSVYFTSPTTGFIAGGDGLLKTTDGGNTWSNNLIPTTNLFTSVFFTGTDTGYVAGNTIYKTTDGGNTWNALPTITVPAQSPPQGKIQFTDGNTGFVYEQHGLLVKTTDGGTTWNSIKNGFGLGSILGFWFLNNTTGFVTSVDAYGGIEKTSDGGTTWTTIAHPGSADLFGVHFPTATEGWAVGSSGAILKTSDGGTTWTQQTSGTTERLQGVHFINNQIGVVVGLNGTILKTNDGGSSWNTQVSNSMDHFHDVHFFDVSMGCAVGNNSTIRTTTTVGEWPASIRSLSKKNSLDIELYPNPAGKNLFVQSKEKMNYIKITTSLGTVIFEQQIDSKKESIDTGHLSPGNYYLIVDSKTKKARRLFSVEE